MQARGLGEPELFIMGPRSALLYLAACVTAPDLPLPPSTFLVRAIALSNFSGKTS